MNAPDGNLGLASARSPTRTATDSRPPAPAVEIRHVRTHAEFAACVELQRITWGAGFTEQVPLAILKVSQRIGGVTAGAFTADDRLVGFVFGITGVERGRIVHWSDMLAVREEFRNGGLGLHLKEFQREAAHAVGASVMYWTYDPLVARNAHLNFNKLGVRAVEYVEEMYGETTSDLHRGIGTDRLIVAWQLDPAAAAASGRGASTSARDGAAPLLNPGSEHGAHADPGLVDGSLPPTVRIEIPANIAAVQATSMVEAGQWRIATRRALRWAFSNGYEIAGFYRDASSERAYYVLTRTAPASTIYQDV